MSRSLARRVNVRSICPRPPPSLPQPSRHDRHVDLFRLPRALTSLAPPPRSPPLRQSMTSSRSPHRQSAASCPFGLGSDGARVDLCGPNVSLARRAVGAADGQEVHGRDLDPTGSPSRGRRAALISARRKVLWRDGKVPIGETGKNDIKRAWANDGGPSWLEPRGGHLALPPSLTAFCLRRVRDGGKASQKNQRRSCGLSIFDQKYTKNTASEQIVEVTKEKQTKINDSHIKNK